MALADQDTCPHTAKTPVSIPQRPVPKAPISGVHYVGTVTIMLALSDTGRICEISVIKGVKDESLNKEALDAIQGQIFQPIRDSGRPVPGVMVIQRNFWRGDTSDILVAENANASPDEITAEAKSFVPADIATLIASGKVKRDEYVNEYFGVSFTAPGASFTAPSTSDQHGRNVRLVDASASASKREDLFTISILADGLSNYPDLRSRSEYMDRVRTGLEREGAKSTRGNFPYNISNVEFVGTIVEESDGPGLSHKRGIFATVMKGYILSIDVAAPTETQVLRLISSIRFKQ